MSIEKQKAAFLKKLGKRIAYLREVRELSQSQLALDCDKDRQSIHRLEQGSVNPSTFYLLQICKALDISLSELFDTTELK